MNKINSIAIANRGEVACRIIKACREMGIRSILLHSKVDEKTRAYRMADHTVCIGEATASESYLNIQANVDAALSAGADALHPGFGFLSENAEFAKQCEQSGITFIGPSAETIDLLGDKIRSKKLAEESGVPMVPGYQGEDQSVETLMQQAHSIGYPVIAKAAAGGGGRGMKVIRSQEEAKSQIESAQREALSSFGSEKIFLEKYLDKAKHIEIQIFADRENTYHLYDRECSVQRRHQKIIEEACSANLSDEMRDKISQAAVRIVSAAKYLNAGTVEFLVQEGEFYFLEVNTRLQVEHPVTEMVLGIDLVRAQIKVAQGESVDFSKVSPNGHSIECRIYAEDPITGMPSTGELGLIDWPQGTDRRFEYGVEAGDEVSPFYDSMIAKVVVWDHDRARAIEKMKTTLRESVVFGVKTNIPYLLEILSHAEFVDGSMNTQFIANHFAEGLDERELSHFQRKSAEMAWMMGSGVRVDQSRAFQSYWRNI